jgi:hypothetical protein
LEVEELLLEIDADTRASIRVAEKCRFVMASGGTGADEGKMLFVLNR